MFTRESNSWPSGSQRLMWEWRTGESSATKFSFTHASKLLLVLGAKTWRRTDQLFVSTLSEMRKFSTVQSLKRKGVVYLMALSGTRQCAAEWLDNSEWCIWKRIIKVDLMPWNLPARNEENSWSRWPRGLRRGSAAARFLELRVRIPRPEQSCRVCVSLSVIRSNNKPTHLQWVGRRGKPKKERRNEGKLERPQDSRRPGRDSSRELPQYKLLSLLLWQLCLAWQFADSHTYVMHATNELIV
jgi:hypothetical protein